MSNSLGPLVSLLRGALTDHIQTEESRDAEKRRQAEEVNRNWDSAEINAKVQELLQATDLTAEIESELAYNLTLRERPDNETTAIEQEDYGGWRVPEKEVTSRVRRRAEQRIKCDLAMPAEKRLPPPTPWEVAHSFVLGKLPIACIGEDELREHIAKAALGICETTELSAAIAQLDRPDVVKQLENALDASAAPRGDDGTTTVIRQNQELAVAKEPSPATAAPKEYYSNWRELLAAIKLNNNSGNQRKVRSLHQLFPSPINFGTRGKQPFVERNALLNWWDGLESRHSKLDNRRLDKKATTANQHNFGREGTVVPDIAGSIRRRRGA